MTRIASTLLACTFLAGSALAAKAEVNVVTSIKPVHSLVAAVMEGIGNTGTTSSLMDLETARRVGLQIEVAQGLEFGTYFGPGSKERPYAGHVVGPVVLRFGKEV